MTRDISDEHAIYRAALEQIARYKHTPRAYRHQKFEQLVKIAQEALAQQNLFATESTTTKD